MNRKQIVIDLLKNEFTHLEVKRVTMGKNGHFHVSFKFAKCIVKFPYVNSESKIIIEVWNNNDQYLLGFVCRTYVLIEGKYILNS